MAKATKRWTAIRRAKDEWGRVIGVRRLKPSERAKVVAMTPDLGGGVKVKNPKGGRALRIPHRTQHFVAAAVCELDGLPIKFPRSRRELSKRLDRLDIEGLTAALKALVKLT